MIKMGLSVILQMFRYARSSTIEKIAQYLVSALIPSLAMLSMQFLLEEVTKFLTGQASQTVFAIALLLLIYIGGFVNNSINQLIDIQMEKQLNANFTQTIITKYQNIRYEYFENVEAQNVISHVGNNPHFIIRDYFLKFIGVISKVISIVSLFIVFLQINIFISLFFVLFVGIMAFANVKATDSLNRLYYEQTMFERKQNYLCELLSNKDSLSELKVFDSVRYIKENWNILNKEILKERIVKTVKAQKYKLVSYLAFIAWIVTLMIILFNRLDSQAIAASLFITVIVSSSNAFSISQSIAGEMVDLAKKRFDMNLFKQFLQLAEVENDGGKVDLHITEPVNVEFKHVVFAYPNTDKIILDDLSFSFSSEENLALVGINGAGKSTIIKLLCGLYSPTSGSILVNGQDLNRISPAAKKKIFSVAFQDYARYFLTVRENVALGDVDKIAEDEAVQHAMHMGMADQYNFRLDDFLGKIEEEGMDISGGQWQRLAISRACIADSSIIILDEPTAALDPIAENDLYNNFLQLSQKKGCLIISHRLASARIADRIIVLSDGKIVENGTHDVLMEINGLYAGMFKAQMEWYQTT